MTSSLGDENLTLMDVNTEHPHVIQTLEDWIASYVKEFQIDGLRIDAAKHVPGPFWTSFCGKAGVFCMGEVFGDDLPFAASFQTQKYLDSVLGFPYYNGLVRGFGTPMGNMSGYIDTHNAVLQQFPVRSASLFSRNLAVLVQGGHGARLTILGTRLHWQLYREPRLASMA